MFNQPRKKMSPGMCHISRLGCAILQRAKFKAARNSSNFFPTFRGNQWKRILQSLQVVVFWGGENGGIFRSGRVDSKNPTERFRKEHSWKYFIWVFIWGRVAGTRLVLKPALISRPFQTGEKKPVRARPLAGGKRSLWLPKGKC